MTSKKKKLSPEQELRKNARRFKGKRITKQVRVEKTRYQRVKKLAEDADHTISREMDRILDKDWFMKIAFKQHSESIRRGLARKKASKML